MECTYVSDKVGVGTKERFVASKEKEHFMKQAMDQKNYSVEELNRFYDYDVFDKDDHHIGNVTGVWEDRNHRPAFIGAKTTWLFGKTHVIPLQGASIDSDDGHIYVAYDEEKIKDAPSFELEQKLSEGDEMPFYRHYGLSGARASSDARQEPMRSTASPAEEATMQLTEEELKIGKRQVESGGVRLRKIVRTETVNQPVELKREDVVIERVPANEASRSSGKAFQQEEQVIPLQREEPVVEKERKVREEVRATKRTETERRNISETVRKEDVEVLQGQHAGEERLRGQERMREEREQSIRGRESHEVSDNLDKSS